MNRAIVFAFVFVATGASMTANAESPDRVDPVLDCSTPVLDADTPEKARLILRLTGDDPVDDERMTVCGEPLTVEFVAGQMYTRDEIEKLHSNNLEWFRGKFPGLQGTYTDEREIVLEIYMPEAEGADVEALKREAESRLGAPLRIEMTTAKVGLAILDRAR